MGFFFSDEERIEYEKEHPPKEKKKRISTGKLGRPKKQSLVSRQDRVKKLGRLEQQLKDSKKAPKHFDVRISIESPSPGKIISQFTFFTEDGLRFGFVNEYPDNKFKVKLYNTQFDVVEEREYDNLENAQKGLRVYIGETGEIEESGLIKCMRDVLTKINQVSEETFFMFQLLTNPELRKEYEVTETTSVITESVSLHTTKTISNHEPEKLSKQAKNLRSKIKGL